MPLSFAPFGKDKHILKCRTGSHACIYLISILIENPYHVRASTGAGALFFFIEQNGHLNRKHILKITLI
jgi:hypothetical protein